MSNVPSCHRTYQKAEILHIWKIYNPERQKTKSLWHDPCKGVPKNQGAKFGFLDFEGIFSFSKSQKGRFNHQLMMQLNFPMGFRSPTALRTSLRSLSFIISRVGGSKRLGLLTQCLLKTTHKLGK